MAREELARLLSCLLKRGQSARCCDDLAKLESRLFAELLHWKNSFRWFRFLLLRGTAESGALKANALPGGAMRLAVRAVKGAQFAFIGAERETLDRRSGRIRRRFSAGRAKSGFERRAGLSKNDQWGQTISSGLWVILVSFYVIPMCLLDCPAWLSHGKQCLSLVDSTPTRKKSWGNAFVDSLLRAPVSKGISRKIKQL